MVTINLKGLPAKVLMHQYRIDSEHSNSYEVWKKMGSPQNPSADQIAQLEQAGQLDLFGSPQYIQTKNGEATIKVSMPRQAVGLLKFDW